jgi:hypothetical protein
MATTNPAVRTDAAQEFKSISMNRDQLRAELGVDKERGLIGKGIAAGVDVLSRIFTGASTEERKLARLIGADEDKGVIGKFLENSEQLTKNLNRSNDAIGAIKGVLKASLSSASGAINERKEDFKAARDGLCAALGKNPDEFKQLTYKEQIKLLRGLDTDSKAEFFKAVSEIHNGVKKQATEINAILASSRKFANTVKGLSEEDRAIVLQKGQDKLTALTSHSSKTSHSAKDISQAFTAALKEAEKEIAVKRIKKDALGLLQTHDKLKRSLISPKGQVDFKDDKARIIVPISNSLAQGFSEFLENRVADSVSRLESLLGDPNNPIELETAYKEMKEKVDAAYKVLQAAAKQISTVSLTMEERANALGASVQTPRPGAVASVVKHLHAEAVKKVPGTDIKDTLQAAVTCFTPLMDTLFTHITELLKIDGVTAEHLERSVKPLKTAGGEEVDLATYATTRVQVGIEKNTPVDDVAKAVTKTCKNWAKILDNSRSEIGKSLAAAKQGRPKEEEDLDL